jgi:hypothetical protein
VVAPNRAPEPDCFAAMALTTAGAKQQFLNIANGLSSNRAYRNVYNPGTTFRYFHKKMLKTTNSIQEVIQNADYKRYGIDRGGVFITFSEFYNIRSPIQSSSSYMPPTPQPLSIYRPPVQHFTYK